uniref:Suppressor of Ty 6 homolog n=5 Tax=Parascaris univalens TaxID=6257 RepID=A0A915AX80_PARUN
RHTACSLLERGAELEVEAHIGIGVFSLERISDRRNNRSTNRYPVNVMSEFIDNQAEESENSGNSTPEDHSSDDDLDLGPKAKRARKQKKTKMKKKKRVASDDDDDEEDVEDDEARIKKEMAGFVVDEDVDEEDDDNDEEDDKSDNEKDDDLELDDEDLDLLNDNLDIQQRPTGGRVVIESDEEEDDRERIKHNLFAGDDYAGDDEERAGDRDSDRGRDRYERGDESGSESGRSEDDFIVTDDGHHVRHRQRHNRTADVPEQAMDEARDVFGVDEFNFEEFYDEDLEPGDEEEEYPEEEDREEGEGGVERVKRTKPKEKKATLLDTIEPAELEEKLLAPRDKRIQLEDKPERFQLRRVAVIEADEHELELESKWIYQYAFDNATLSIQEECCLTLLARADQGDEERRRVAKEAPEKIKEALNFIRNQLFEVPFIAFYRKEYVESCLVINDLWKVYQWDEKWCHLQQRKKRLLELMKRMLNYQMENDGASGLRVVTEQDMNEVHGVQTVEGLMDVSAKFQLYYGHEVPKMIDWETTQIMHEDDHEREEKETRFRAATRTDKYMLCIQNGIDAMAARFGLTPQQFAENLEWKRHDVIQDEEEPLKAAEQYVCQSFPTPESVLSGAVHVVAKQLSREPKVREMVRMRYRLRLRISVHPTKKGREEIDESHKLYRRRYIKDKPVKALHHDEYLWYVQARNCGLLNIRLHCDTEDDVRLRRTFLNDFLEMQPYHKDEFSNVVEMWNKIREEAVTVCINEFLIPVFEREVHERLLQEARDYVVKQCTQNLYERIKTATYHVEQDDDDEYHDDDLISGTRIVSLCYPEERDQASFCALINHEGQVVDHLRLVNIVKNGNSMKPGEANLKRQDMEYLGKFIAKRRPHVVAICGENLHAYYLKRDIEIMLRQLAESNNLPVIPVEIVDNEAAKVYMHSKQAATEFPDYPLLLKQAVSLGRLLLDPLIEYCHMCNIDQDVLCISYHPLQTEINKDDLMFALSLEFINRVNEVGVDVHRCLEYPYTANMLQFVCGLGPRKAANLLKVLKQNDNLLESRTKLVTLCRMGPKVFMNCAGFIKLDTAKVSERTDAYVEVLDGSRVHPETYEWARKMAVDALEIDDTADPTSALEEILQNPDKLKDLDLDAFADELARQGFGNKSITLYDIRAELNHRYKDLRIPYESPSRERIFTMLTKETPASIGKLMLGRVLHIVYRKPRDPDERERMLPIRDERTGQWKCQYCYKPDFSNTNEVWQHIDSCPGQPVGVKVRFDNGITGFVPNKYISDRPDSFVDPSERMQRNQPVYCRILDLDPEKFSATCSCRSSDLRNLNPQNNKLDDYFDREKAMEDEENERKIKEQKKVQTNFVKRVISHPSFHNVTYRDAERMLQKFEQGEAIIRPSSKSVSHLTVTWKVAEGIYQHIDVKEEGKQHQFSLGKTLLIGSDEFEDLDEILARHIQPMAAFARDVLSHKYFLDGVKAEDRENIEMHLADERKRDPTRIPYTMTPSQDFPGKFVLSYMPVAKVKHEYFTVTPEGFRFRQQIFPGLMIMLTWFKEHYREPPPGIFDDSRHQR